MSAVPPRAEANSRALAAPTTGRVRFSSARCFHKRCCSRVDTTRTGSGSLPASREHGRTFRRNEIENRQRTFRAPRCPACKLICTAGGPVNLLSSHLAKNIPLRDLLKSALSNPTVPCPPRGAYRDRHGRWARDAMDAKRRAQSLRGRAAFCGRRSRVVLAPRRWRQVSLA